MTATDELMLLPLNARDRNTVAYALRFYAQKLREEQERTGTGYDGPLESIAEVESLAERVSSLRTGTNSDGSA